MSKVTSAPIAQDNVVEIEEPKKERQSIRGIIDFVMSQRGKFTIHDVYAKFPGRKASIQPIIAILAAADLLTRTKLKGEFAVNNQRESVLYARVLELETELAEALDAKYDLGLMVERMIGELNQLRQASIEVDQAKLRAAQAEAKARKLEAEVERLTRLLGNQAKAAV